MYGNYFGKVVTMDGAVYHAQEISFHTPSEHKINGETFPIEMQVVHYGQSIGDTAKQVILSFLFKKSPGIYNKFLESIDIFNLPNPLEKEIDLSKDFQIPDLFFNVNEDSSYTSMPPFSFYTYEGSLTRPPCAEKTIHYVASQPLGISSTVIEIFKEALRIPDLQNENGVRIVNESSIMQSNRQVQKLNERSIFHYESKDNCPSIKKMRRGSEQNKRGHYERKTGTVEQFFHVTGDQPSGMPGAFVVTEQEAKNSGDPEIINDGKIDDDDAVEKQKLHDGGYEDEDDDDNEAI